MLKNLQRHQIFGLLLLLLPVTTQAQTLQDAIQFYKYHKFESAVNILSQMAQSDPNANYYLGLCEIALENPTLARTMFEKYPESPANQAGLARVLFLEKKPSEAMAILEKVAAKARKKDITPLLFAADAITYTKGGDPNKAIEWYKKALDVEKSSELYMGIGDAYRKIDGGDGNAVTNYEYAEETGNQLSLVNYKMGDVWLDSKVYDSALSKFSRASNLDPKNPLPYKALADAYYKVKKFKLAKENIEKYLELSDKTPDDQFQYANILYLAKDYTTTVKVIQDMIQGGVEKPYLYRILGYCQFEQKEYEKAKTSMDNFFAKQPKDKTIAQDYMTMAKILLYTDSTNAKIPELFAEADRIDTAANKNETYKQIGDIFFEKKMYPIAATWYEKIIQSNNPKLDATDFGWCGLAYYYGKDYTNADRIFSLSISKFPTDAYAYLWKAKTLEVSQDKEYKTGAATTFYTQWISMVKDEVKDRNNLIRAYTYLARVAYNMSKKEDLITYCDKLLAIDPADKNGLDLKKVAESMK